MGESGKSILKERRFECQKCGYCCSQRVVIYPNLENIQRLSKYLNISECSFALRYLREIYDPKRNTYLIAFKTNYPGDPTTGCIFCQEALCSIYDSPRTDLCHLFPWNHFNLEKEGWDENFISHDGAFWCPGIGKGRLWSLEEIRKMKKAYPNVGIHLKLIYNPVPASGPKTLDVCRPSSFNLTMSEEQLIHKWRSLSMEKQRDVESFVDSLYHGGHP